MKPIVYIDILFILNFLIDSVMLYSTSLIIKRQIHIVRLIVTSGVSALYATVMFFPQLSFIYSTLFKAIMIILISEIAFPTKNFIILLKNAFVFFIINSVFGGVTFLLIFFTDFGVMMGTVVSNGEIYFSLNTMTLFLCIAIAYGCIYFLSYIKKTSAKKSMYLSVLQLDFKGKSVTVKAFADTGCLSEDPLGHASVIILNRKAAAHLTGKEFFTAISRSFSEPEDYKYMDCYKIIPYCTIDSDGIMDAFVPDKAVLDNKILKDVVVGISKNNFSEDSGFDAIFNPCLSETINFSGGLSNVKKTV